MSVTPSSQLLSPNSSHAFVWRDLLSVDPERSAEFFTSLFGWTQLPVESGSQASYRQLLLGDEPFGGILELDRAVGHPSHWISYARVQSVNVATAKAERLGGTIASPPAEIAGVDRFAVLADRQGALFCVLQVKD